MFLVHLITKTLKNYKKFQINNFSLQKTGTKGGGGRGRKVRFFKPQITSKIFFGAC